MGRLLMVVMLVILLAGPGGAQDLFENYKINVDDLLYISVWGHADLQREVLVGPDGYISFPLVGEIMAVGRTVQELTDILTVSLSRSILDPDVNVALKEYRRLQVLVLGEVTRPGSYRLSIGSRLLNAISAAGGPTQAADLKALRVTRGETSFSVNLETILKDSETEGNIKLEDGDVLFVPNILMEVTVLGEVARPGTYKLNIGSRFLAAVSAAGGPTQAADLKELTLTRGETSVSVNLEAILKDSDTKQNLELEAGDVLFVPDTLMEVTILGEVKEQGMYQLKRGIRFSDLLARAGGLLESAAQTATINTNGVVVRVDLKEMFAGGFNPVLNDGDSIFIPHSVYRVAIMGEVNRPGTYPWHAGLRLVELISQAGNIKEQGNKENIAIITGDGELKTVNFSLYLEEWREEGNPYLQAGDVVIVTEAAYIDWERVFFFIGGLNALKQLLGLEW